MTARPRAAPARGVALCACACVALAGCVARIAQERIEGPARPEADARPEVDEEWRVVPTTGARPAIECREVERTPMVREVRVHRSFADTSAFGPQATNLGLATVLGAAAVLAGYDLSSLACAQNGDTGCSGQTAPGAARVEELAAGLAAIPVGLLVLNAVRVSDTVAIEPAPDDVQRTDWRPCGGP